MSTPTDIHEDIHWPYILTLLPEDMEGRARSTGALRRTRGVTDAAALLRLLLCYAVTDFSLKEVAGWGRAMGLSCMSAVALFFRVRNSAGWLEHLLGHVLASSVRPARTSAFRVRLVDATCISGPKAEGTEWRVHVLYDASSGQAAWLEVTDEHGGESFGRFPVERGDLVVGDRGYGHARGIAAIVDRGADVLVRLEPSNIRLLDAAGQRFRLDAKEASVPKVGAVDFDVQVAVALGTQSKGKGKRRRTGPFRMLPARVVGARTKGGAVIWCLTTAGRDAATAAELLELYRVRWQIELNFKRWKSLADLGACRSRKGPTARAWILARLLGAALADRLASSDEAFFPWGYVLRDA